MSVPDALRGRRSKPWSTPPVVSNAFNVYFRALKHVTAEILAAIKFWQRQGIMGGRYRPPTLFVPQVCELPQRGTKNFVSPPEKQESLASLEQCLPKIWAAKVLYLAIKKRVRPLMCSDLLDTPAKSPPSLSVSSCIIVPIVCMRTSAAFLEKCWSHAKLPVGILPNVDGVFWPMLILSSRDRAATRTLDLVAFASLFYTL